MELGSGCFKLYPCGALIAFHPVALAGMYAEMDAIRLIAHLFHYVNFARCRPFAVALFYRHHPYGRPQTSAFRKFGADFKPPVFKCLLALGCQTRRGIIFARVTFFTGFYC